MQDITDTSVPHDSLLKIMFIVITALYKNDNKINQINDYRKAEHNKWLYLTKLHIGAFVTKAHRFLLLFDGPFFCLLHIVTILFLIIN